ncbi:MAG: hypothetical protein EOP67_14200 [Sphingomonas sp.]|nr:MAG: hypothetical protein EOP67_14200 [Sphingomonas sp.]
MSAVIELRGSHGAAATPVPSVDPGCMPIRTAIMAVHAGYRGVIVEVQVARPRLAELVPPSSNGAHKHR